VPPFCEKLETRNFTANPSQDGITASSGIEAALDAFLIALSELDYDAISGIVISDAQESNYRLSSSITTRRSCSGLELDVAILL